MSKILLVNPPFYSFMGLEQNYVPLSLLAVGSYMTKCGETVFIKNLELTNNLKYLGYEDRYMSHDNYLKLLNDDKHEIWQMFEQTIKNINPDIIGFTILNVKYRSAKKAIEIAQRYCKNIIVGGFHPTQFPEKYKTETVFGGEYESKSTRLKNLDELPLPNYDILLDTYTPDGYGHIISARGCPFNCRFCASKLMWNRKVTYKSIDRLILELEYVQKRFNPGSFTFWDETFTLNKNRVIEFCSKYNKKTMWRCDTRADHITDDLIKVMKNANCGQMSIGIESGNNEILKYIGKDETIEIIKNAADILNKNQINWKAYCIIGFPQETEQNIFETLTFIKSLNPARITLSYFTPYQGTDLYEECIRESLILDNYETALYAHQSPYNYFSKYITKERYSEIKKIASHEIDMYNKKALEYWK